MKAILYTSNTGTTAQYAKLLGEGTGLPVYSLDDSAAAASGSKVLYLGWVMAGSIQGYKKAAQRYRVSAVCGVCMGATGGQIEELRQKNSIPAEVPLFTLQGGFDINRLHGVYKMMMRVMVKTAGKALSEKENRNNDEEDMLGMMLHGGNRVSRDNLSAVLDWYRARQK